MYSFDTNTENELGIRVDATLNMKTTRRGIVSFKIFRSASIITQL